QQQSVQPPQTRSTDQPTRQLNLLPPSKYSQTPQKQHLTTGSPVNTTQPQNLFDIMDQNDQKAQQPKSNAVFGANTVKPQVSSAQIFDNLAIPAPQGNRGGNTYDFSSQKKVDFMQFYTQPQQQTLQQPAQQYYQQPYQQQYQQQQQPMFQTPQRDYSSIGKYYV
ncbi:hypothetical protein EIN_032440, partial [Entamoeba invadens IP1]